jgi:hypothetical protein
MPIARSRQSWLSRWPVEACGNYLKVCNLSLKAIVMLVVGLALAVAVMLKLKQFNPLAHAI